MAFNTKKFYDILVLKKHLKRLISFEEFEEAVNKGAWSYYCNSMYVILSEYDTPFLKVSSFATDQEEAYRVTFPGLNLIFDEFPNEYVAKCVRDFVRKEHFTVDLTSLRGSVFYRHNTAIFNAMYGTFFNEIIETTIDHFIDYQKNELTINEKMIFMDNCLHNNDYENFAFFDLPRYVQDMPIEYQVLKMYITGDNAWVSPYAEMLYGLLPTDEDLTFDMIKKFIEKEIDSLELPNVFL